MAQKKETRELPVRFGVLGDKPMLSIVLSDVELQRLGPLKGDNVGTLKRIQCSGDVRLPDVKAILEAAGVQGSSTAGRSLKALFKIAGGKSKDRSTAGSNITVILKDEDGDVRYRANPIEPDIVAKLGERVQRVKDSIRHDHRLVGIPTDETNKRLREIDDAHRAYRRVFELAGSGLSPKDAGIGAGVTEGEAKRWLSGQNVPFIIASLDPQTRRKATKEIEIPKGESTAFAYVLGARAAVTRQGGYNSRLNFSVTEKEVIKLLQERMGEAFGRKPDISNRSSRGGEKPYHDLKLTSIPLAMYINKITEGNTRLPWEHLVSKEERIAFMHGFLDFTGSVSASEGKTQHPSIEAQKLNNDGLIKDAAVLFKSIGILPTVKLGRRATLSIFDQNDLATFMGYGGFTSKETQSRLMELHGTGYERRGMSMGEYQAVMAYTREHSGASAQEASRETGVGYDIVRGLLRRGQKPKFLKRLEAIEKLEKDLPDPDAIGFLYRGMGLESKTARAIAAKRSIKEVRENIELLQSRGKDMEYIKEHPMILSNTKDEIIEILAGRAGIKPVIPEKEEERPPYAGFVDNIVREWDNLQDPCATMYTQIKIMARRHAQKGGGRDEIDAMEAEITAYALGRMSREKPKAHEKYAEYVESIQAAREEAMQAREDY
ncbi:MAG: hypothetical protein PHG85_03415 [Candidatus Altiarchaeota archaeon]|nr:hypothetical protein [Candidatus Altiarchaeota archaeon]